MKAFNIEGGEALSQTTWTGKKINYSHCLWHIGLRRQKSGKCIPSLASKARRHTTDIVDQPTRSRMMAAIKGRNTKPELAMRRALHSRGLRFRLHVKNIAGRPDLVFPKFKAVVFVHGCFWHRHEGCKYSTTPSTRPVFWQAKFRQNIARDSTVRAELLRSGWRVSTAWECALRTPEQIETAADLLSSWLRGDAAEFEIGETRLIPQKEDLNSH
jgi:DNA mismatch endonuclease (patch repair protein)